MIRDVNGGGGYGKQLQWCRGRQTSSPLLAEIDKILSMTLIANLTTLDQDDGIYVLPMWFLRVGNDICIPTSSHTHKYRNLRARPGASMMIDVSRAGLDLKGVLIRGFKWNSSMERRRSGSIARCIWNMTPEGVSDANVAAYLSKGDDVTLKIHMDHLISWNLADSKAGKALSVSGGFPPLDA